MHAQHTHNGSKWKRNGLITSSPGLQKACRVHTSALSSEMDALSFIHGDLRHIHSYLNPSSLLHACTHTETQLEIQKELAVTKE